MANQKIKLRNSATLTSTFIILLLVMGMFFGGYTYLSGNLDDADIDIDDKYSDMYSELETYQGELETKTEAVQAEAEDMRQAEGTIAQIWNGIQGLAATLLLILGFIPTVIGTYQSIGPTLDFLPGWVEPLIYTGILVFIVFLIVKVIKGEPHM